MVTVILADSGGEYGAIVETRRNIAVVSRRILTAIVWLVGFFTANPAYAWYSNCHSGPSGTTCYSPEMPGRGDYTPSRPPSPPSPPQPTPVELASQAFFHARDEAQNILRFGQLDPRLDPDDQVLARKIRQWLADSPMWTTQVTYYDPRTHYHYVQDPSGAFILVDQWLVSIHYGYSELSQEVYQEMQMWDGDGEKLASTMHELAVKLRAQRAAIKKPYDEAVAKLKNVEVRKSNLLSARNYASQQVLLDFERAFAAAQIKIPDHPSFKFWHTLVSYDQFGNPYQHDYDVSLSPDSHALRAQYEKAIPPLDRETPWYYGSNPPTLNNGESILTLKPSFLKKLWPTWSGWLNRDEQYRRSTLSNQRAILVDEAHLAAAAIDDYVATKPALEIAESKRVRQAMFDVFDEAADEITYKNEVGLKRDVAETAIRTLESESEDYKRNIIEMAIENGVWLHLQKIAKATTIIFQGWRGPTDEFIQVQHDVLDFARDEDKLLARGPDVLAHGDPGEIQDLESDVKESVCTFAKSSGFDAFPLPAPYEQWAHPESSPCDN